MDFNKHDDILKIKDYDGFISPDGYFYKVKKHREENKDHNLWAKAFLEKYGMNLELKLDTDSLIFQLSSFRGGPSDSLVQLYGYIYYSHDGMFYKPIIQLPNPKLFGKRATEDSLDMLYNILLINDEKKAIDAIFRDNVLSYTELDESHKTYKKR